MKRLALASIAAWMNAVTKTALLSSMCMLMFAAKEHDAL